MATGQRANRPGSTDEESGEVPENTDEGDVVAPVGGTVVTEAPPDPPQDEPEAEEAPPPRAPPRAAAKPSLPPKAPAKRPRQPDPEPEDAPEVPANDPRATRILSVESIDAPARFELLVTAGPARGGRFPLNNGLLTVGRSAQCDCSILDEAISRRHFELQVDNKGVLMRDLGSGNGTLVNGERADEVMLAHGDVLHIGDSTLELRERGRAPVSSAARNKGSASTATRMPAVRGAPRPKGGPNRRPLLIGALAVGVMFIVILGFAKVKAKQQAIAQATAAFERGRQQLEQGNADEALEEFQRAIANYPDPNIIQEKAAIAMVISDGNKALTHARDLIDQKDFTAARKVLDGIQHNDYLDAQVKTIRADIDKREAEIKAAEKVVHEAGVPIDPMTQAEAHDYWQRAKKEGLDAAYADMSHAYDMLASKGAGGADFELLKADYVEILKQIYVRYKRASPAKAELALEKANSIIPDSIPPGGPVMTAPSEGGGKSHASKHTHSSSSHRHAAANDLPRKGGIQPPSANGNPGAGSRYDEGRAEELDDAGDSLLGQDPAGAKEKYRQALKLAPPDSEAANRARAGLSN